jgi:hypothetical protein
MANHITLKRVVQARKAGPNVRVQARPTKPAPRLPRADPMERSEKSHVHRRRLERLVGGRAGSGT